MKKIDKLTLFLIPIGVAVNFIGGQIAILLKLPLYLDAIGTITVGALCGGIPGAIVGVISNVLKHCSQIFKVDKQKSFVISNTENNS